MLLLVYRDGGFEATSFRVLDWSRGKLGIVYVRGEKRKLARTRFFLTPFFPSPNRLFGFHHLLQKLVIERLHTSQVFRFDVFASVHDHLMVAVFVIPAADFIQVLDPVVAFVGAVESRSFHWRAIGALRGCEKGLVVVQVEEVVLGPFRGVQDRLDFDA